MSHPNANNNLLPIEIHTMVKFQTQLLKTLKETQANNPNKELATWLQLVLDAHILIDQMMSQYIANIVNPQELQEIDSEKPSEEMDTSLKACKACGEIGHIAKECPDEWPHSAEIYPTQVTCFLCEGNNHVPDRKSVV